jgi:hypothetical protein
MFYDNINKFNETLDIMGHFHDRTLTFSMSRNTINTVDKKDLKRKVRCLIDPNYD